MFVKFTMEDAEIVAANPWKDSLAVARNEFHNWFWRALRALILCCIVAPSPCASEIHVPRR